MAQEESDKSCHDEPDEPRRGPLRQLFRVGLWFFALIGLACSLLIVSSFFVHGHDTDAPTKTAETSARTVRAATQNWQATENKETCPTIDELVASKHLDSASGSQDPWGNPFRLTCTADEVFVLSAGPDRKEGTNDDIRVPKGVDASTP